MNIPQAPEEPEVKNIIDKLANFVARNGNAFEKMTKEKQKNNPKFAFLFGGQYYNYYQYRLTTEQQVLNQQHPNVNPQQEGLMQPAIQNAPWQQPQGGFGGFPPAPMPPMQQGMPLRPMQPIPPWQQQRLPAPWQQPHIAGPPGMSPQPPILGQGSGPPVGPHSQGPPPNLAGNMDFSSNMNEAKRLEDEEQEVEGKIKQSEENLQQQHKVLMEQEKDELESAIQNEQDLQRNQSASINQLCLDDFDNVLQPIIVSCTKDSIANGKTWILNNGSNEDKCKVIAQQILHRIDKARIAMKKQSGEDKKLFDTQLHLIYLINDVLHHASRKNLSNLSNALETVIVPIFAITQSCANEQNQQRLGKLLGLWSKFNYFSADTMSRLSDPEKAFADYQEQLESRHSNVIKEVKSKIQSQYEQFKQQHDEYTNHLKEEIAQKRENFEKQKNAPPPSQDPDAIARMRDPEGMRDYRNSPYSAPHRHPNENIPDHVPWSDQHEEEDEDGYYNNEYNQAPRPRDPNFERRRPGFDPRPPPPDWRNEPMRDIPNWDQDREQEDWRRDGPERFDDRNPMWGNRRGPPPPESHPPGPPNIMGGMPDDAALIPKAPYYDLPAGLMAPLVNLEDMDYKELDPARIRLPPPVPPSDRLLAAVEAFYAPPSHERPRNAEGWEHNGLFEFFRAKVRARRRVEQGRRDSRSRSHERRSYSRDRSYSRSSSRSRSRSSRSRSRSNSRSPGRGRRRSPPSFGPAYYQHNANAGEQLDGHNPGAKMMKKMGWGGSGLGSNEQGIQDPVKAGDVRDKYDQFKGLGMDMNDPYETYRKTRSYGYGPRARGREAKLD